MEEDWPVYRAWVRSFGQDRIRIFVLLRETLGVSPVEAKLLLATSGVEIARDTYLDRVKQVAARFRAAGARVKVEIVGTPHRVSAAEALQFRVGYPGKKPIEIEGHLVVTGLFSYLAPGSGSERGIPLLVNGPRFAEKLTRRIEPRIGGSILIAGKAVVAGHLYPFDLPMFPLALVPVIFTYYPEAIDGQDDARPVRMEFF